MMSDALPAGVVWRTKEGNAKLCPLRARAQSDEGDEVIVRTG
jgi:hypothetical protein